jgi:Cd2+/Zn2+-exporting ATPase
MSEKGSCGGCSGESAEVSQSSTANTASFQGEVTSFRVAGMDCGDEIAAIQKALSDSRIANVKANLMSSTVRVEHESTISKAEIRKKIESTGVRVAEDEEEHTGSVTSFRLALVASSGLLTGLGMLLDWKLDYPYVALGFFLGAVLSGGSLVFPKAWRALRQWQLDMNVLMSVAAIGAFAIKEYSEAATVVFLFALSELLEAFSLARARKAIREVLDLTPEEASVIEMNGVVSLLPVAEVKIGQIILVKSGERIPLDGEVIDGVSTVNQAPLTGESLPVEKKSGDSVFAGTVNETGVLKIKVSALFTESKVSKVIRMIEEAQEAKAPSERFVDRFAKIYTPAVFVAAILAFLIPPLVFGQDWNIWFYRSLVLLVVACPCALVLATPVSIVSGLTAMARRGVLVKGGAFLEALGGLKAIAVDKTGTITEGRPRVLKAVTMNGIDEKELVEIAASLEQLSSHPLAQAVMEFAKEKSIVAKDAKNFETIVGRGAQAAVDGHEYFVGNHRMAHELGVCTPDLERLLESFEENALSVIVVGHRPHNNCAGNVLGVLALGDAIRPNAREAIQALHRAGIEKVIMLSGDNQKTANAIAKQAGIDEAIGDLLPDGKVAHMKALLAKHKSVAMIGDGINDAPALALATVGIAMGAAGTDTAIETADVALMKDELAQVAVAIQLGKRALRTIRFNIGFALAVKAVFLVLAFFGFANLWLAVAADTGTSLLVIANALRLLR